MVDIDKLSKYNKRDSLEFRQKSEKSFEKIATERGWRFQAAKKDENINQQWNYRILKSHHNYRVNVESIKRISRHDASTQDERFWI